MKTILGTQLKDWSYIILSPITGFALLGLFFFLMDGLKLPTFPTYIILIIVYSILFDVNHYFSTYYRVFMDKVYYRENKNWMIPGLLFITIVPLLIYWWTSDGSFSRKGYFFFVFFRRFVLTLGFYHLIKQNWGFMAMYKAQANERKTKINWDSLSLLSGSFIPFTLLNIIGDKSYIWFPSSGKYILDPAYITADVVAWWHQMATVCFLCFILLGIITLTFKRFQYRIPAKNVSIFCLFSGCLIESLLRWDAHLILTLVFWTVVLVFLIAISQSIRYQLKEKSFNVKKWAVFASTLILYFGIILFPFIDDKLIVVAAITLPHNIQYLAFVPIFSRRQYEQDHKDHGIAKKLSYKVVSLFIIGVAFSIIFEFGRTGSQFILPNSMNSIKIFISVFFVMLVLHHYYLDAVIWKFSKNKDIKKVRDN